MMLSDIQHSLGVTGLATDLADICSKPVESLYRVPSDALYILMQLSSLSCLLVAL